MGRARRMVVGTALVAGGCVAMGTVLASWAIGRETDRIPVGFQHDGYYRDAVDHGLVEREPPSWRTHSKADVSGTGLIDWRQGRWD